MFPIFQVSESVGRFLEPDAVQTETTVFHFTIKFTTAILLFFGILVSGGQYIGDPIHCFEEGPSKISFGESAMDAYCWLNSLYTVHNQNASSYYPRSQLQSEGDTIRDQQYYKWIFLVLITQAIMAYLPRFLWQTFCEGRKMETILGLRNGGIDEENQHKPVCLKRLVEYLAVHMHTHNKYAISFFVCEVLNFVIAVGQLCVTNCFLDKGFPCLVNCLYHKDHPDSEHIYIKCLLPVNEFNGWIYYFLWYWFVSLVTATGLALIYRLVVLLPQLRLYVLKSQAPREDLEYLSSKSQFGDWFILVQLSNNVNPELFQDLISDLAYKLQRKISPFSPSPPASWKSWYQNSQSAGNTIYK